MSEQDRCQSQARHHVAPCISSSLSLVHRTLLSLSCFGIRDCSSLVSESVECILSKLSDVITLVRLDAAAVADAPVQASLSGCSGSFSASSGGAGGVSGKSALLLGGSWWCGWYSTCACAGSMPTISTPSSPRPPCTGSPGPEVLTPSKSMMWTLSRLPWIWRNKRKCRETTHWLSDRKLGNSEQGCSRVPPPNQSVLHRRKEPFHPSLSLLQLSLNDSLRVACNNVESTPFCFNFAPPPYKCFSKH